MNNKEKNERILAVNYTEHRSEAFQSKEVDLSLINFKEPRFVSFLAQIENTNSALTLERMFIYIEVHELLLDENTLLSKREVRAAKKNAKTFKEIITREYELIFMNIADAVVEEISRLSKLKIADVSFFHLIKPRKTIERLFDHVGKSKTISDLLNLYEEVLLIKRYLECA